MPQTDPDARPIVIVDPRAGHGPGIAGFKPDSQVGVAMRAGHPVYFITFGPDPVPGQTLADIAWAEAKFIETVRARHTGYQKKPAIIGNCQAGWAVAALAAVRPEIMGPILLNGAPMSYWAGSAEQNPMRYSGGTLGGSWMASMSGDLGGGVFDGQYLVNNFENLNPANTLWGKHYNLYANIDTEEERFLDFERWWGGYFRMTTAEIESIVENLFVGNRLAAGTIELTRDQAKIDLRNISSPIVVFASFGDNITPPPQAECVTDDC
jgi:poly(3-hydroxyalkanoate) synthetase